MISSIRTGKAFSNGNDATKVRDRKALQPSKATVEEEKKEVGVRDRMFQSQEQGVNGRLRHNHDAKGGAMSIGKASGANLNVLLMKDSLNKTPKMNQEKNPTPLARLKSVGLPSESPSTIKNRFEASSNPK